MAAFESAISPARLARYLPEAKQNKHLALRLYVWNSRLCEAFYLPTQVAEVATRNAIHKPIVRRFGLSWFDSIAFKNILPPRLVAELEKIVTEERAARRATFSEDHVVAGLSFGFWQNLMTQAYDNHLWANGVRNSFPHLPRAEDRQTIYDALDQLRRFRNKIAHHYAIFDRGPRAELQNTTKIIGWICGDTRWLVDELTNVVRVLSRKPQL